MRTLLILCVVALAVVSVQAWCQGTLCNIMCANHNGGACANSHCVCSDGHVFPGPLKKRENIQCATNDQCTDATNHCHNDHVWVCEHEHCKCKHHPGGHHSPA